MHKITVIGGSASGVIAAGLAKAHWGPHVQVTLIYDHKNPGIGVGESLTPQIYRFLDMLDITREDMIKNVNATVKLGLKFKNWLNDGKYYYHGFNHINYANSALAAGYDIIHDRYTGGSQYDFSYYENSVIPDNTKPYSSKEIIGGESLHIDATLFSKYIEQRIKNDIEIVDDVVLDVIKNGDNIESIVLEKGGKHTADFYIDASGFATVLYKHMGSTWVDKSDWLPINRCIPNPVPVAFTKQPTYTTSEATDNGWILQVPLQNRWGSGYLYSSQFTSDEEAFDKFNIWRLKNYASEVPVTSKILKFKSGYWKESWRGNCIAVGLACGFTEPLEATNIHHTVTQLFDFFTLYNLVPLEIDRKAYNKQQTEMLENIYLYLRFCYTTGRTDSEFWKYMTNSTPDTVKYIEEKIKLFHLVDQDISGNVIFKTENFTAVAVGLKKPNPENIKRITKLRNAFDIAKADSEWLRKIKINEKLRLIDHKQYINSVLNRDTL